MLCAALLLGGYLFSETVWGQSTTSYVEPNVPTGVPIAGDYGGPLRPQIHFSPPKNFMNGAKFRFTNPPSYAFNTLSGMLCPG